jgi:hypothetical protein
MVVDCELSPLFLARGARPRAWDGSWPLTRVFRGRLAVVGGSGTFTADQSPVWRPDPRLDLVWSEREKYRERHHCARRNHEGSHAAAYHQYGS